MQVFKCIKDFFAHGRTFKEEDKVIATDLNGFSAEQQANFVVYHETSPKSYHHIRESSPLYEPQHTDTSTDFFNTVIAVETANLLSNGIDNSIGFSSTTPDSFSGFGGGDFSGGGATGDF